VGHRISSFRRVALAALLMLACVPHTSAATTLAAQIECPKQGPHRACLRVSIVPSLDMSCDFRFGGAPYENTFVVTGRLKGARPRQHRLRVDGGSTTPPSLAYLGQSPSGRTIVLTDQGPLEILDKAFNPNLGMEIYLVDKQRWKIKARMIAAAESGPYVTTVDDIGMWDKERQLCISAPIEPRQRLRVIEGGCSARPTEPTDQDGAREIQQRIQKDIRDTARVFARWYARKDSAYFQGAEPSAYVDVPKPNEFAWIGNVEREHVTLKQVRRLLPRAVNEDMGNDTDVASHFGGMGTGIRILRIKGSETLIVSVAHDGGC
jgi:hypothetical protein